LGAAKTDAIMLLGSRLLSGGRGRRREADILDGTEILANVNAEKRAILG
jgi:hypothetical protein